MKEIEEIYEDMKIMVGQIESDDVVEEVEEETVKPAGNLVNLNHQKKSFINW